MKRLYILIAFVFFSTSPSFSDDTTFGANKRPQFVSGTYYWDADTEPNIGIEIVGKFNSKEAMESTLNFLAEIGSYQDRKWPRKIKKWILADILVSIEFDMPEIARWKVSGPKPLLLNYVNNLERKYKGKNIFYDFGYTYINFNPIVVSKVQIVIRQDRNRLGGHTASNLALPAGGIRRPHPRLSSGGRGCGSAWSLPAIRPPQTPRNSGFEILKNEKHF